ncbi:putative LuxR family transcriptional regulator [Rubrivivax sp. A210]|uniref:helix-turn-helix transcriptional regulator n=1 Tax=Rubrivivax sp. A210 TaxID=2772301 RepID=UPI0019199C7B|nr:autoinducer binding domain-containing protein [Rubrivivax sp. A210]CAD5366817.1 putative LuxR family transcriptional regulator [Rubrivivax sp. A210]
MATVIEICESMLEAETMADYHRTLEQAAQAMGCERFGGFLLQDRTATAPGRIERFHNVPAQFAAASYVEDGAMRRDPVMQAVKRSTLPLAWGQDAYIDAGRGEQWEELASWGMLSGMILALHLPGGRHFCLGVESSRSSRPGDVARSADLANLSLVVAYAHAAGERLIWAQNGTGQVNPLSPRERECLLWCAAGKTAWETGVILSISESTVGKHLDAAIRKLNCSNRTHAVATALQAGWLG